MLKIVPICIEHSLFLIKPRSRVSGNRSISIRPRYSPEHYQDQYQRMTPILRSKHTSSELIMLPTNFDIQQNLMEIPFPPPLPQPPDLLLIQGPPNNPLKLLLTNLLIGLALLTSTQARLEPCLHAHAHSRLKGDHVRITADLNTSSRFAVLFNGKEGLAVAAVRLQRECTADFGWDGEERFVVADRRGGGAEEAVCIGGEVSEFISKN
jgi:hypothetical protein